MEQYTVFDIETTGFSPTNDDIIEIGALKVQKDIVVDKFNCLIKTDKVLNREIQDITHITNDMLKDGENFEDAISMFNDFVGNDTIMGYNISFDAGFVRAKSDILGYDFTLDNTRKGIDVLKMARKYSPNVPHKLNEFASLLGIKIQSTDTSHYHRASYDAYVTKLIYDFLTITMGEEEFIEELFENRNEAVAHPTLSFV